MTSGTAAPHVTRPPLALLCCTQYAEGGGIERVTRAYESALRDLGWQVSILDLVSFRNRRWFKPALLVGFIRSLRAIEPDLILMTHAALLPLARLARMLRSSGTLMLVVHGQEVWNGPQEPLQRSGAAAADIIVSGSRYTAERMARTWDISHVSIVGPPVPLPATAPGRRLREDRVLCVSRLTLADHTKHVDWLLAAVQTIMAAGRSVRLDVVGDGDARPDLELLAESLGLGESVRFWGRVDDATLQRLYNQASIFCLPSVQEGYGLVFLEAMSHGLPVVAVRSTAVPELVTAAWGFLAEPGDVGDLAAQLVHALDAVTQDHGLRDRCARWVDQHHSHSSFVHQLEALLHDTS